MSDTDNTENTAPTAKERVVAGAKKTAEVADKVTNTAEVANNAFGALKWIAIAVTAVVVLIIGWGGYNMVTKPVAAVSDAAGAVVETVSEGAGAIKDGTTSVLNRLQIATSDQSGLNRAAETAFPILFNMDATESDGMMESAFRTSNFMDSNGQVCKFSHDFGGGLLTVFAAADVDGHKTAASLGSKEDRLIRMVIRTENDDIMFNTQWDDTAEHWIMKWKRTTVSKPLSDKLAEARLINVLTAVPTNCGR